MLRGPGGKEAISFLSMRKQRERNERVALRSSAGILQLDDLTLSAQETGAADRLRQNAIFLFMIQVFLLNAAMSGITWFYALDFAGL